MTPRIARTPAGVAASSEAAFHPPRTRGLRYGSQVRTGKCGECGGTEIYAAANGLGIGAAGTEASLHAHIEPGFRGVRPRQMTYGVWQYLCATCGHLQFHVIDGAGIDFARRTWLRVPVQPED